MNRVKWLCSGIVVALGVWAQAANAQRIEVPLEAKMRDGFVDAQAVKGVCAAGNIEEKSGSLMSFPLPALTSGVYRLHARLKISHTCAQATARLAFNLRVGDGLAARDLSIVDFERAAQYQDFEVPLVVVKEINGASLVVSWQWEQTKMPQSAKRQLKDVAMPSATDMEMGAPPAKEASAIARPLSELTYYLACDSVWLERVGEAVIQDLQVNKSRYVPGETARQVGKGRVVVCAATVCGKESDQEKLFCHTGAWPQTLAGVLKWLMPAERATLRMPLNPGDAKDPRLAQLAGLSKVDVEGVLDDLAPKRPAKGSKKGLSAFESIRKAAVPCGGLLQARAVVKALADSQTAFGARDAEELLGAIEPYIQGDEFLPWATTMVASGNSGQTALGMRVLGRLQAPGLRPVATEIMVKFSVLAVCPLSHKGRGCR